ncbi:hypothetical protein Q8F57_027200 [Paraburkholderia terrae]|uniref:hypothetical protein n=1 Tax=Paraburkholderia terrae TaxID=311230 RepID=UPI00296B0DE7|nr:hypothetical protein [Paraburkholderia terrae]MDW3660305.1 hypothetical protein [Paraburkholderia terrae]
MSVLQSIENEFNAIVADARSVPEKLAALVGLHTRAQELQALELSLSAIVEDASKATADKVSEILHAVGKQ